MGILGWIKIRYGSFFAKAFGKKGFLSTYKNTQVLTEAGMARLVGSRFAFLSRHLLRFLTSTSPSFSFINHYL